MEYHFRYPISEINNLKLMNLNVYNYKIKNTNKYLNILIHDGCMKKRKQYEQNNIYSLVRTNISMN